MTYPIDGQGGRDIARKGQARRTDGSPAYARTCRRLAVVPTEGNPSTDLCGALTVVGEFALGMYAETKRAALLARVIQRRAGALDLGSFGSTYRQEKRRVRTALAEGEIHVADGRSDPAFFGGQPRLLQDFRRWEEDELTELPIQLRRLGELEATGIDVVELPTNTAVDMRFAGLSLAQPIAICRDRFRQAEAVGRVTVKWLP